MNGEDILSFLSRTYGTEAVRDRMSPPDPLTDAPGYIADYLRRQGRTPSNELATQLAKSSANVEPNILGRALSYIPPEAMLAANFLSPSVRIPTRIANPIRAYHGSPHDFDKFDMSKIGSGEGAQAFGHGLYFAENEGVARNYRNNLSPKPYVADKTAADKYRQETLAWLADRRGAPPVAPDLHQPGRMYEVALHATPEQFLDWDALLGEQSVTVRQSLQKAAEIVESNPIFQNTRSSDGARRVTHPKQVFLWGGDDGPAHMSRLLAESGIPGLRYLDEGFRSTGSRTRNYVIWDPSIIEIIRKYGIAAPVAGGVLSAAHPGGDQ